MTALIVAVTTFLVPATARADVTDVNLSVAFDRLSTDRVATVTLKAKSESGVTGAEAVVEHLANEEWTPIATVPLTRTGGTANDGTWTAEYQTDIENRPGTTKFTVKITSADGATVTEWDTIDNCYRTVITDLATSPASVDADTPVTVTGRVLVQKTRDADPAPTADVSVRSSTSTVQTGADGTFSFTHPYKSGVSLQASVGEQEWLCEASEYAPEPEEFTRQSVELSAEIVTPQPVQAGDEILVQGLLRRNGADGPVPATYIGLELYQEYGSHREAVAYGNSIDDGTFRLRFTAQQSGKLIVESQETNVLSAGSTSAGTLQIERDAEITDFEVTPSSVEFRKPVVASGWLNDTSTDQKYPIGDATVTLEYSETGETWSEAGTGKTNTGGRFEIESSETVRSGYWRARYAGADGETRTVSDLRQVRVKYGTRVDGFDAEKVSGGEVLVKGELVRLKDEAEPAGELPIYFYFMAEGTSTWEYQGTMDTWIGGSFGMRFPAQQDGYWTAAFWGDDDHIRSNAPIKYVDVPGQYTTKFTEFGASPATVEAGESITVKGLLTRSVDGGAAEAAPGKPVYVYFLPAGSQTWEEKALVQTNTDGRFEKAFTAEEDGYWTAWFFGDDGHLSVNSGSKHVDVQ
ncbi:hypothetical protein [Actinomadura algeriensis]|uniref:5-hydroxyisourate hydrolase-like protein (Transthyretin family) n=1 Tax=Actinomadura algeriensis TaxID=1679523 RepID=A0ABR9JS53_9ACTN|nr:hypothetical protein [Actinomadura algeriensis]MBE1533404.1 5-hydroxyisourate hydrolase-like protein (transthyretin family) [Actinomadura algeriensis]